MSVRVGFEPTTTCYSHRNGEMDSPTQKGFYFFAGLIRGPIIVSFNEQLENESVDAWWGLVEVTSDWRTNQLEVSVLCAGYLKDNYVPLSNCRGQWWGAIVPPWRKATAETDKAQVPSNEEAML